VVTGGVVTGGVVTGGVVTGGVTAAVSVSLPPPQALRVSARASGIAVKVR
jgi:hypothetical protein